MNIKTEKHKNKNRKNRFKKWLKLQNRKFPTLPSLKHDSIGQHLKQLFVRSIH